MRGFLRAFVSLGLLLGLGHGAAAERFINLGPSDGFALGQPVVTAQIYRDSAGSYNFGPFDERRYFLLDTGANGIVLDGGAYQAVRSRGYQTVAKYVELGVSGETTMDVSDAYRLDYVGRDGNLLTIDNARIMSNAELDFGSLAGFYGIVGMPGMAGRVMSMGINGEWISTSGELSLTGLSPPVTFPDELPADSGHRYTVPLRMRDFPQSGQQHPEDPLPTWAPLPFVEAKLDNFGLTNSAEMLVDTGSQLTVISSELAMALGVDENGNGSVEDEAFFFMEVSGIGGTTLMPIVQLGGLRIQTAEGVEIELTDLSVGVRDIDETIDGIFGMNFFTEGWTDAVYSELLCELDPMFCGGETPEGYFYDVHFDFRDIANMRGTMVLDLNPAKDVVEGALDGDTNHDGRVDIADLNNVRNNFGAAGSPVLGDTYPFNGTVDIDDLNAVRNNFGVGSAGNAVPEPGSWALATMVIALGLAGHSFRKLFALQPSRG